MNNINENEQMELESEIIKVNELNGEQIEIEENK